MHSWFTQKLNEMIGLAHYCGYPILKAHFVLTQQAVDEIYNQKSSNDTSMGNILGLLLKQAENDGDDEVSRHLRNAVYALKKREADTSNVVELSFDTLKTAKSQSGA